MHAPNPLNIVVRLLSWRRLPAMVLVLALVTVALLAAGCQSVGENIDTEPTETAYPAGTGPPSDFMKTATS